MASLALVLNTAEQTLMNTQTELATASNNISNANTTGYARQTAVQVENPAISTLHGWMGAGASIKTITQTRDNYLEQQLMNATGSDSQYTSLASQLTSIQATASDSGSNGISQALGNFFDSWSTLAQNPTGTSQQTGVDSAAQNLASSISSTYSQLSQINSQFSGQISDTVDQANTLINQISQLNTDILKSSAVAQPNDLIDQRYAAMDSLAKLIPVSFSTNSNGSVNVDTVQNNSTVNLINGADPPTLITDSSGFSGGQLGGLLTAQSDLAGYMNQFDYFAGTLITEVNKVTTASSLPDVFSGTDASTIAANSGFLSGQSSDTVSSVAQSMSALQDQTVQFTTDPGQPSSTLQQYLGSIQQTIGADTQNANNNQTYYDSLKSELQSQQQSLSGVSIDEELVNIMKYQQIYQAAAKVVQTTSTLMNTVINMVQ
ncbi:MAG: flagellar hook-associated protein FlgK [Syntrophobacteraceae bacterium]|nr:flagellar hook-associated protein FlgK [Syntrophobacteraceae bacterium]